MTEYANKPVHPHAVVTETVRPVQHAGVTLREHFAGLAMLGLLASESEDHGFYPPQKLADAAAERADALIERLARDGAK